MKIQDVSGPAWAAFILELGTSERRLALTDSGNRAAVIAFADGLAARSAKNVFVVALDDPEVPEPPRIHLPGWRSLATEFGWPGPIAYRVKADCRLAEDCPRLGSCYQNWDFLKTNEWARKNDEPTKEGVVFFIPRIVPGSTAKTVDAQLALLGKLRQKHGLPSHHLANFGSAALDAALILAYFRRTGERIPEDRLWIRTDTFRTDGSRLFLGGFGEDGLVCDDWYWAEDGYGNLGCFALGVEAIGQ